MDALNTQFNSQLSGIGMQTQMSQQMNELQRLQAEFKNPKSSDAKKLKEAAQQFEGIFIKQLLDQMDKTIERGEMFHGGSGEEMFRGMLNDAISTSISTRLGGSGFGIAENIYQQMAQQFEQYSAEQQKTDASKAPEGSKIMEGQGS